MSDLSSGPNAPKDDDLLANAIPIESDEDESEALKPIDIDEAAPVASREIRAFGAKKRHEDQWARSPNANGTGAIHVKTFVAKLRLDAIEHMDQQINEWLDQHPQYEVKLVTTSIGALTGKLTEPAMFVTVWV